MVYDLIRKIDISRVFRRVDAIMLCLAGVLFVGNISLWLQPKDALGPRWVQVHNLPADFSTSRPRDFSEIAAEVTLPNDRPYTFHVFAKRISDEGWLCAKVSYGRWTKSFDVDIVRQAECKGLLAPKIRS